MNRQLLKLPLYTLAAGVLTRLLIKVISSLALHSAGAWAVYLGDVIFYAQCVISAMFFIITGLRLRKIYTRSVCFRAASVLALYSLLSLVLEQRNAVQRALRFAELLYVPSHRDFHTDHGPADAILL